ncbi:class I SAM-dependent methyltransferase [Candidatus Dependentiae bacterium]|nr:MAG: class I SAM-dependent methyltransferase [Candidatus Dependentiae bacterium]
MPKNLMFDCQMTTYDMAALEELVETIKPVHSLEVGSWKGQSTSIIARHSSAVYCVDTWRGAPDEREMVKEAQEQSIFDIFWQNMSILRLTDKVKPLIMTSDQARVIIIDDFIDFIYIDGDHTYDAVKWDLDWFGKLKKGGYMAGHDYDDAHGGVRRALDERFEGQFKVLNKSSIWVIQKA